MKTQKVGNDDKVELPIGKEAFGVDDTDRVPRAGSFIRTQTLQQSARAGSIEAVIRFLDDKANQEKVNDLDEEGTAALHYAARGGFYAIVVLLIEKANADTNVQDDEGATPLHYAARKKKSRHCEDTVKVIQLLSLTADLNARDKFGSTPLHFAAMKGNVVAASALIACGGVLVNAKDHLGCTPLHEAATYNHASLAELLLKNGAKVLDTDQEKCTPLHLACGEGVSDVVSVLNASCDPTVKIQMVQSRDCDDKTPLHYAIEARNFQAVQILLKEGAEVNARCRLSSMGSTCLHLAAIAGDEDIVKVLLDSGAKISSKDLRGATPLHKAAEYDSADVARVLLRQISIPLEESDQDQYTPLMTAVSFGSSAIVRMLLKEGAQITVTDDEEKTTIFSAVEYDHKEVLKILLKEIRGTENAYLVNSVDTEGNAALHVACAHGSTPAVKMLLKCGADISVKNESEETPFIMAAQAGQTKVVELLLKQSEKVINDEDEYSNTALHHAASNGHLGVVRALVRWGADKEARNNRSRCPLDLAAAGGHLEVVKYLLSEDVSPNPLDKENVTPLHLASRHGYDAVVTALIAQGADVSAKDVDGFNCLEIAIDHGHRRVAVAILESKAWHIALAHENRTSGRPRNTPLRKLIEKMPDVASVAMSRCVTDGPEGCSPSGLDRFIEFNYDYLDDTFTNFSEIKKNQRPQNLSDRELHSETNAPYSTDSNCIKENHPLILSLKTEDEDIVSHPLVIALARHKWSFARLFYFLYLLYYIAFLTTLSAYMLSAQKPYDNEQADDTRTQNSSDLNCPDGWQQTAYEDSVQAVIWILASIGIIVELLQAFFQRILYLNFINLFDWFSFVSAFILMFDIDDCGLRTNWQWQMGAFTILITWLNLILYLRRLPGLGIYIVMIVEIFRTFAMFFLPFMLFILAFSMSFHLLLANQDAFSNPFFSIVRTFVMMIGELDYMDTFFSEDPEEEIAYEGVTFAVFIIFVIVVSIIIMNLLVGLAVDDVNGLRERARVVKLRMQIDFALDVELAVPDSIKRRFKSTIRRELIFPNVEWGSCWRVVEQIQNVVEGPLMSREAVLSGVQSMEAASKQPDVVEIEKRLMDQIQSNRDELKAVTKKLDVIHSMLANVTLTAQPAPDQERGRPMAVQWGVSRADSDEEA